MSHTLLSSGSNAHGQLSNNSLEDSYVFLPCSFYGCPPETMPPQTRRVIHITTGANHTIVLLETSDSAGKQRTELWGCGDGRAGQLGADYRHRIQSGESSAILRPINLPLDQNGLEGYQAKFVASSWETTYIALSNTEKGDVLISMGTDDFGDLGIGGLKKGKGREMAKSFHIVDISHLTVNGESLKARKVFVQSLTSGQHHVIAHLQVVLGSDRIYFCTVGWGTSRHGQLEKITSSAMRPPAYLPTPSLVQLDDLDDPIVLTALGSQHTVFLHASGKVTGIGSNRKGQLQGVEDARRVLDIGCTWNGTYMLIGEEAGVTRILAAGSHAHGQLGRDLSSNSADLLLLAPVELPLSSNTDRVTTMACGTEHVLALIAHDGLASDVWGWGWNEHGNLGNGRTDDVFIPIKVWPPGSGDGTQVKAVDIWAGSGTSWIYLQHYSSYNTPIAKRDENLEL